MRHKANHIVPLLISLLVLTYYYAWSQDVENKTQPQEITADEGADKKGGPADGAGALLKKDKKLQLTVERLIDYLFKNNLDVKTMLLEYKGMESGLNKYQARYDTTVYGKADYTYSKNPNKGSAILYGEKTSKGTWSAGLSRKFNTGTTLEAGLTGYYSKVDGALYGMGSGHQTGVSVTLYQELLKNAFGTEDRLTERKIANSTVRARHMLKMQFSGLLVEALAAYWQIAIAEENLATMDISVKSATDIRNLVAQKSQLGLSEVEDVSDWNNKVLQLKNGKKQAEQMLFDARLGILRTLNMDADMEIELGQTFSTDPPAVTEGAAMGDALLKRLDLEGQRIELKNAELEYRIAANTVHPSLKLKVSAGTLDYDSASHFNTYDDVNQQFYAGLELTYPLGNSEAETRFRDARLAYQKQQVAMAALEKAVKDEVSSAVKNCDTTYTVYQQSKQAHQYAKNYYFQVLAKFRRGRYNTFTVKQALDEYIKARYNELDSLVKYNVALLKRDNARNMIFQQFNIPMEEMLKQYEK